MTGPAHRADTRGNRFREWLPPALRRALNRIVGAHITYDGPYPSWQSARSSTAGYDEDAILARVVAATRSVLCGEARYEQDGVTFACEPPPSQALAALLLAASRNGGELSVLDFGGALASTYLRWRPWLQRIPRLHWSVVEQAGFVREGRRLFADASSVSFHDGIASLDRTPNVVLASSVLQYLPTPYELLEQLLALPADMLVIDRTPFADRDLVAAQRVPRQIGEASYPLWVLSQERTTALLSRSHELLVAFDTVDEGFRLQGTTATYRGAVWVRR